MITLAYLLGGEAVTKTYSPLKQFTVPNSYYPTAYKIYEDGKDHIVSLINFDKH